MTRSMLREYVEAGFCLVPIARGEKSPTTKGWQRREAAVTDPEVAELLDDNIGLCHAYSGTCALDLDDLTQGAAYLAERGIDAHALIAAADAVMVSSGRPNRAKLLYRLPKPLRSFKLPGFELRCAASNGNTVQDVLPPSVHPDTGKPYEWRYGCELTGHWSQIPDIPEPLHAFWLSLITPETKVRPERTESAEPPSIAKMRKQLERWDPSCGYDEWVKVGMRIFDGTGGDDAGLTLWDEWSSKGANYQGIDDLRPHWRSFTVAGDNGVSVNGLRKEDVAAADEFDVVSQEQVAGSMAGVVNAKGRSDAVSEAIRTLERDKSGTALATIPNVSVIFGQSEMTGIRLSYDDFKDVLMCAPDGTSDWRPFNDNDYTSLRIWLETTALFYPVCKDMARDAVRYVAEQQKMDTAKLWLQAIKWDGVPRVDTFMPVYMGTPDREYERAVGRYLWTAFGGRVMSPGCQVDMVPILVGRQGIGKSQGIKALVPDPEFYTEIRLDEEDDAIARKMRGTLVGEIAELRGLRTSDQDRIKAFVTRTHEKFRPLYCEFMTTFARRLVMIGTTNEDEFLDDPTGNRRWLPVRTTGVDVEAIKRDRDQLWAEGMYLWQEEGIYWQEAEALARLEHEEFQSMDEWEPLVAQWLSDNPGLPFLRSHDVLTAAIGLDARHVTRAHTNRVGKALRSLGYERTTVAPKGQKPFKAWVKK